MKPYPIIFLALVVTSCDAAPTAGDPWPEVLDRDLVHAAQICESHVPQPKLFTALDQHAPMSKLPWDPMWTDCIKIFDRISDALAAKRAADDAAAAQQDVENRAFVHRVANP